MLHAVFPCQYHVLDANIDVRAWDIGFCHISIGNATMFTAQLYYRLCESDQSRIKQTLLGSAVIYKLDIYIPTQNRICEAKTISWQIFGNRRLDVYGKDKLNCGV